MGMCSNSDNRSPYSSDAAASRRRSNKPLMEKRRRERINKCLSELQALLVDNAKAEHSHSKLEKADILEMTVKHIRSLKRMAIAGGAVSEGESASKYRAGYVECAARVSQYLAGLPVEDQLKQRMMTHLMTCPTSPATSAASQSPALPAAALNVQIPTPPTSPLAAAAAAAAAAHSAAATAPSSSRASPAHAASSVMPSNVVSVAGGSLALLIPSAAAVADSSSYARLLGFPPSGAIMHMAAAGLASPMAGDRKSLHPEELAQVWRPWSLERTA